MRLYNPIEHNEIVREHNLKQTCSITLFCCQLTFYESAVNSLQTFLCYLPNCK